MTWNYAYTPNIWLPFLTLLFLLFLGIYSWRRRNVPGAVPFAIGGFISVLWVAGYAMEVAALEPSTKVLWFNFQAIWIMPAATAVTCFCLEYVWPRRWLTRRNLVLLSIPILVRVGLIVTNDFHHLMWLGFVVDGSVSALRGPAAWFFTTYTFALGLLDFIVYGWLFLRSPQHRWPVSLMLIGDIAARVIFLLDATRIVHTDLPLAALPMPVIFLLFAIALFGFRVFDPVQMARQTAIEQLQAGMIVLDPQGRVASLNPTAERILGASVKQAKGQPVKAFLPAYPDRLLVENAEIEIDHQVRQETRYYALSISPLKDWRGLEAGRLLMLHDVTEQKKAQAKILEQQRVLATLNERERMARELHDSLGQVLSYTSFQVGTAAKLSRDGQGETAAMQLDRLGNVVREAHDDLRETILNLHSTASLQQPIFTAIKQYLDGFTTSYNVQTLLNVDPACGEEPFTPEIRLQIFRILQEALSNARKHGRARQVQISFALNGNRFTNAIEDDGCGFDANQMEKSDGSHYGLKFMQERAVQLGGTLQVQSEPGKGTQVWLEIPLKKDAETR